MEVIRRLLFRLTVHPISRRTFIDRRVIWNTQSLHHSNKYDTNNAIVDQVSVLQNNLALLSTSSSSTFHTSSTDKDTSSSTVVQPTVSMPRDTKNEEMKIIFTERCRTRLEQVLESDEYLRIGVRGGGCSGFEYEFSIVKHSTIDPNVDQLFEEKVVIDTESIEYMNGAQLDYEEELIRSGFRIVANPLAEKGCSCGASFSLKF
ncbi:Iron-sulfur cluster assembly 2, mitochondrial [Blomia tropicalis]|nr:Iron-sulfur cluster assembly 2, mitochondrial [Blomia tropicalis]